MLRAASGRNHYPYHFSLGRLPLHSFVQPYRDRWRCSPACIQGHALMEDSLLASAPNFVIFINHYATLIWATLYSHNTFSETYISPLFTNARITLIIFIESLLVLVSYTTDLLSYPSNDGIEASFPCF